MNDHHSQYIALLLIVSAAVAIAIGEHYGWRDLVGFSLTFGGAGCGILTGQKMANVVNKDGGNINVDTEHNP